ncbi:MAG: hypothetical protein R8M45_02345 [Ghiorsea sp.]
MGTSAGITQGLMNGLNIYNSISDRKDRKEQYATGLQRQEAADERSTTLFDQGQGEFERKTKLRQDTANFNHAFLTLSNQDASAKEYAALFDTYGIGDELLKPNQKRAGFKEHKNKAGDISYVPMLRQMDENGQESIVPLSHGRSADQNDPAVGMSIKDMRLFAGGHFASLGVDISAMNNMDAVKPMTDREKIAANQANKLINIGIEAKNAEDAAIAKFGRGGGSGGGNSKKATFLKPDKGEIQFAEKVLKAAGVADVNGSARHAAGIFKALSAQGTDTKKAWASALQSAKDGIRSKKGFIYDSDTFNASLNNQSDSAAKAKALIDGMMGDVPAKETPKKPNPVAAQNGLPTKAKDAVPQEPANWAAGLSSKKTSVPTTKQEITAAMKQIEATQREGSPVDVKLSKAYRALKTKLSKLDAQQASKSAAIENKTNVFNRNLTNNYSRGTM